MQAAIEEKLLGGNASRTFYTQTLLPGMVAPIIAPSGRSALAREQDGSGAGAAGQGDQDYLNGEDEATTARRGTTSVTRSGRHSAEPQRFSATASPPPAGNGATAATALPSGKLVRTRKASDLGDNDRRIYDHDMVRVDARAQTLEKYLAPSHSRQRFVEDVDSHPELATFSRKRANKGGGEAGRNQAAAAAVEQEEEEDDWDPIRMRPRKPSKDVAACPQEELPQGQHDDGADGHAGCTHGAGGTTGEEVGAGTTAIVAGGDSMSAAAQAGRAWPMSETDLASVYELRQEVTQQEHTVLKSIFKEHKFVGCVSRQLALVQYQTRLYVVKTKVASAEMFYQLVLRGFERFNPLCLEPAPLVSELVRIGLDRADSGWTAEDGPKDELAHGIAAHFQDPNRNQMLRKCVTSCRPSHQPCR